jgi:hypothetical protein
VNWEKISAFRNRAGGNLRGEFFWLTKTNSSVEGSCVAGMIRNFADEFRVHLENPGQSPPPLKILVSEGQENTVLKNWLIHCWEAENLDVPAHIIQNVDFAKRCLLREIFSPLEIRQPLLVIILGGMLDVQEIIGDDLYYQAITYAQPLLTAYIGLETIPRAANTFSGIFLESETESDFVLQLKKVIPIR